MAQEGWYKDPAMRFDERYWTGEEWTNKVKRKGAEASDKMEAGGLGSLRDPREEDSIKVTGDTQSSQNSQAAKEQKAPTGITQRIKKAWKPIVIAAAAIIVIAVVIIVAVKSVQQSNFNSRVKDATPEIVKMLEDQGSAGDSFGIDVKTTGGNNIQITYKATADVDPDKAFTYFKGDIGYGNGWAPDIISISKILNNHDVEEAHVLITVVGTDGSQIYYWDYETSYGGTYHEIREYWQDVAAQQNANN